MYFVYGHKFDGMIPHRIIISPCTKRGFVQGEIFYSSLITTVACLPTTLLPLQFAATTVNW